MKAFKGIQAHRSQKNAQAFRIKITSLINLKRYSSTKNKKVKKT